MSMVSSSFKSTWHATGHVNQMLLAKARWGYEEGCRIMESHPGSRLSFSDCFCFMGLGRAPLPLENSKDRALPWKHRDVKLKAPGHHFS